MGLTLVGGDMQTSIRADHLTGGYESIESFDSGVIECSEDFVVLGTVRSFAE